MAGIHRLLAQGDALTRAGVVIVVAGMDGALPSVVGGLVACPVIAVPTSVGYGASLGGLAALFTMLNSCAAGVTVAKTYKVIYEDEANSANYSPAGQLKPIPGALVEYCIGAQVRGEGRLGAAEQQGCGEQFGLELHDVGSPVFVAVHVVNVGGIRRWVRR